MKVLILNSGRGSRMGDITDTHPKCMTELLNNETILSRQLKLLKNQNVTDIIITTGYYKDVLMEYCNSLNLGLNFTFVHNEIYDKTNYIYSIYCAKDYLKNEDIILLHGDLVFEESVLKDLLNCEKSCMKVSSTLLLPEKDFKAVIDNGLVKKVGVEFFENAMEAQAMYRLNKKEWNVWLDKICEYCETDRRSCYAEKALNEITDKIEIIAYDVKDRLCAEIDNPEDLAIILNKLKG